MHDEFSALFRTNYETLANLLNEGVMQNDSHPAGVQLFLYFWVKLVGFNEFWIKLPFAVMGVFSVYLVYLIGKKLFGSSTGLFASAVVGVLQYFVFYSQLARPYAAGLFFILLAANQLSLLITKERMAGRYTFVYFGISLAATAYMQHFAAFTAGLLYLAGWFLLRKELRIKYFYSGLLALIAYLPHLGITYSQLSAGGIGGWLGKPAPDFLIDYLNYLSHYSIWFGLMLLVPLALIQSSKALKFKWLIALMFIFVSTYLVGYIYSVYRTPVLQFSTLYFAAPFLIIGLYAAVPDQKPIANLIGTIMIVLMGAYTLIANRQHYNLMYQQGYDQTAVLMKEHAESYPENTLFVAVGGQPYMFDFYLKRNKISNDVYLFNYRYSQDSLWHLLDNSSARMIGFAWSDYAPYEWTEAVRSRFGKLRAYKSWFNAEYYLFERSDAGQRTFTDRERVILDEKFDSSVSVFSMGDEFGLLWEKDAAELLGAEDVMIAGTLKGIASDTLKGLKFVLEFRDKNTNEIIYWGGGHLHSLNKNPGEPFHLHIAYRFDQGPKHLQNSVLRTYVWNQHHESFVIEQRLLYVTARNPRLLGLFKAL